MIEITLVRVHPPRTAILRLAGEVNYVDVPGAEQSFERIYQNANPLHVVLDLSGLTFLVTPFIGAVLCWREMVLRGGGVLALAGCRSGTEAAFRHLLLDRLIPLAADVESALARLPTEQTPKKEDSAHG